MKKKSSLLILVISLISISCFSQISFEKGYFIDNTGQKTNCLIMNADREYNPTKFEYRLNKDASTQKADIESVQEFGIEGISKFIRVRVAIDESGYNLDDLGHDPNPTFHEKVLFLKVLIEGNISLYYYKTHNFTRFFFKTDDSKIVQLIYKRYLNDNNISENNYFRYQLYKLTCPQNTKPDLGKVKYNRKDLMQFFIDYGNCKKLSFNYYQPNQKKIQFALSLRPGLNFGSLSIRNPQIESRDVDFKNEQSFRLGIEAEFILPYNKNKLSVIIEPTLQQYKSESSKKTDIGSGLIINSKVKYQSIEIPAGIRYHFFLNNDLKIFANIAYVFDFANKKSIIEYSRDDNNFVLDELYLDSKGNLDLGLGLKYKKRYSIESRYSTKRNVLDGYVLNPWYSEYRKFSIIFGFTLF